MKEEFRFIVKAYGYHENDKPTDEKYIIITLNEDITIDAIKKQIVKEFGLSPFRRKTEVIITHLQAF